MIFKKINYFVVLVLCMQQLSYSQVGNYTRVSNKIYKKTYNFLDDADPKKKQYKDKSKYIVYSDRVKNFAYKDKLGLRQGEEQGFLTPFFVIDETSEFLELVKFDESILGKPKGIFSFFYGKKYNFIDKKNVEYVGWMQKNKLLHFSHSKVSENNLKPIVFFLGINNTESLVNLRKYITKDSVYTFLHPDLKIRSKKSFNVNQLVYLYKFNSDKTAALISNLDHMQGSKASERLMGWVPAQLISNLGQRKVWRINDNQDSLTFINANSNTFYVETTEIRNKYIFQPEKKNQKQVYVRDTLWTSSIAPIKVWNHLDNKLLNVKGGDILLKDISLMKEHTKTFNIYLVFDCSSNLKDKLISQISSLQHIWLLISQNERYKNYKFTFGANSYGCNKFFTFPKNNSFSLWIDYIQNVFFKELKSRVNNDNSNGFEKSLLNIISNQSKSKDFENNIVMVIGDDKLQINLDNEVLYELVKISARLLFFQLESTSKKGHQYFVLNAKKIINNISKEFNKYEANFIIDNELYIRENLFKYIEFEGNNLYIYDSPNRSMYSGGIVFPKINNILSPKAFDLALDSTLSKTIAFNNKLIESLELGANNLGFIRSKPTQRIKNILIEDSVMAIYIPKVNRLETYLQNSKISVPQDKQMEEGYLFSEEELDNIIESYKSIIPLINKTFKKKDRRAIYNKYKQYYRELNKMLFYKKLKKKSTIGELIKTKTGISVNDSLLNTIRIIDVNRKSKLSNKNYNIWIKSLQRKILNLDSLFESSLNKVYLDGSGKLYYYIPEHELL